MPAPRGSNPTYRGVARVLRPLLLAITRRDWRGAEHLPRGDRQGALDACAARFAGWLTACLRQSPYDWFNYFDFWMPHADARKP